jgi:hypothetical protein
VDRGGDHRPRVPGFRVCGRLHRLKGFTIEASDLGKLKTVTQIVAVSFERFWRTTGYEWQFFGVLIIPVEVDWRLRPFTLRWGGDEQSGRAARGRRAASGTRASWRWWWQTCSGSAPRICGRSGGRCPAPFCRLGEPAAYFLVQGHKQAVHLEADGARAGLALAGALHSHAGCSGIRGRRFGGRWRSIPCRNSRRQRSSGAFRSCRAACRCCRGTGAGWSGWTCGALHRR